MSTPVKMAPWDLYSGGIALLQKIGETYTVPTQWVKDLIYFETSIAEEALWTPPSSTWDPCAAKVLLLLRDLHSAISTFRIAVREADKKNHEDWRKNPLYSDCSEMLNTIVHSCDLFYTGTSAR